MQVKDLIVTGDARFLGKVHQDFQPRIPHRKLIASYTTAGTYTFNTSSYPSANGYYDIVLIGGGGGGGWNLGTDGGGGGEVVEHYGVALNGTYVMVVGNGGATNSGAAGSNGGNTSYSTSTGTSLGLATGGKGASNSTSTFTGFAGGNGGEDGYAATGSIVGRGGGTKYGLGCLYYKNSSSGYSTRNPSLGGGGAYLLGGADGAIFIYAYVE